MKHKIAGIVLAGGQGARMNNADKGLQLFKGKELVTHTLERLSPQVDSITISANRNIETYRALGHNVIPDASSDYNGPLAGVAACLTHLHKQDAHEYAMICSCDTPHLYPHLVAELYEALRLSQSSVSVAVVGKQRHNLHCLLHNSVWCSLIDAYADGVRAMYRWQKSEGCVEADFSQHATSFTNINTLSELNNLH
ncbi:molybdenum cofactor guanylyltransferase MobA [Arenicella sp. 4NH20-0111]|uniref:molybdenum cofactor guanylyltransferase MobA n=1 Tax=Arenicella sp. 4NH20-0111 TaxID=3127648 RepID=UPI00310BA9D9